MPIFFCRFVGLQIVVPGAASCSEKLRIGHFQAAEPEPLRAHSPVDRAVPFEDRIVDSAASRFSRGHFVDDRAAPSFPDSQTDAIFRLQDPYIRPAIMRLMMTSEFKPGRKNSISNCSAQMLFFSHLSL